jgi:hypothetical protein
MILVAALILVLEFTGRIMLHAGISYRTVCMLVPITIAMAPRATGMRWGATIVTGIYTAFLLGLEWILPLFPAQPKLGPVLHVVTTFIPNGFPLLVIVPAFLIDLIRPRMAGWSNWKQALLSGPLFLLAFLAVEWPFASFLNSPAAHNAFFGSGYLDYFAGPQSYMALDRFVPWEKTAGEFWTNMLLALVCAVAASWMGFARGEWLSRVRR